MKDLISSIITGRNEVGPGNVFTDVYDSVHRGGSASVHAGIPPEEQTPPSPTTRSRPPESRPPHPQEQTPPPPGADPPTPRSRHPPPPGADPLPGSRLQHTVNEWPVCILLECILVFIFDWYAIIFQPSSFSCIWLHWFPLEAGFFA